MAARQFTKHYRDPHPHPYAHVEEESEDAASIDEGLHEPFRRPRSRPYYGNQRKDAQHEWDMNNLRQKLNDMLGAVGEAEMQIGHQGFPPGDEFDEEVTEDQEENQPQQRVPSRYHIPEIDPQELDIQEGELMRKSKGMFHRWEDKYAVIDLHTLTLDFFRRREDFLNGKRPQSSVFIKHSEIHEGSKKRTHKSQKVAFPFMIRDEEGDDTELSAADEETQRAWMSTLEYIQGVCEQDEIAQQGAQAPEELADGEEEEESVLDEEEEERIRDFAQNQTAWGAGLTEAVHGETSTFYIQANDETGEPLDGSLDEDMPFRIILSNDDLELELEPEDNGDGTYYVEYTAPSVGIFELQVLYGGEHIFGSPFYPEVLPAPTAPKHCLVEGEGMHTAHIGKKNYFTIVACDQFDAARGVGGDEFEVTVHGPAVPYDVVDHDNGCYTVSYEVVLTEADIREARHGKAPAIEIEVNLRRDDCFYARPIAGSPFTPRIEYTQEILESVMSPDRARYASRLNSHSAGTAVTKLVPTIENGSIREGNGNQIMQQEYSSPRPPLQSQDGLQKKQEPFSTVVPNLQSPMTGNFQQDATLSDTPNFDRSYESKDYSPEVWERIAQKNDLQRSALDAERDDLERQKAEFAKQRAELDRMRQQVEQERESVGLHMSKVSELGKKVRGDAQKLRQQQDRYDRDADTAPAEGQRRVVQESSPQFAQPMQQHAMSPQQYAAKGPQDPRSFGQHTAPQQQLSMPHQYGFSAQQQGPTNQYQPPQQQNQLQSPYMSGSPSFTSPIQPANGAVAPGVQKQSAVSPVGDGNLEQEGGTGGKPNGMIPGSGGEAPKELFDPGVTQLIDQYKKPLVKLWSYYSNNFGELPDDDTRGLTMQAWLRICKDYMITPTFMHRREIKGIFADTAMAHADSNEQYRLLREDKEAANRVKLSFAAFTEAVGRLAIIALSRPAFAHVYPTPRDKIAVVLDMWGLGRPEQLSKNKRAHKQQQKKKEDQAASGSVPATSADQSPGMQVYQEA
eukprot:gb/GECG01005708.1/.p1 GENE.gb/GECG01005708.1/~~gb/GECG01005708.1/.p1  ORF type:complete len:1018 (+),score=182.29 gb/GECG01005708.1/:1-3054(+)